MFWIKGIWSHKIINLTGQSGSGKSYYAHEHFNNAEYEVVDTDDIFSEERFKESSGINKELGTYFRNKYEKLPNLADDFDLIYNEIIGYCKNRPTTIVIDCAQFHCVKDLNILKGKIIIIRTAIDTCYQRTIERWIKNHKDKNITYTNDELQKYSEKKRAIYKWYKGTNEFIKKVDIIN